MDRFDFYRKWLVSVGVLLAVFGVAMALASGTPLFRPLQGLVDPAFWPHGPADPGTVEFRAWVYGVWGATIAAWGVAIVFVGAQAFARREPWAWHAIALGTALWFVLDTGLSLTHGVVVNAALNVVILVLWSCRSRARAGCFADEMSATSGIGRDRCMRQVEFVVRGTAARADGAAWDRAAREID